MPLAPPDDVAGRDLDQPSGHDATGVVDAPGGRRARSVDPRDLIAARDQHAPNVGTPPAAPAAVPAEASTQQPATAPPMEDDPLDPSGSAGRCPVCAEPNGETRRFCVACGARLSDDAAGDRGGQADDQRRGRRRPRTWRQRARAASEGRLRYGSGFATEAKARAVMLVLVGVASIVALAGPGRERVLAALGRGPTGALPASAQLLTGQGEPGEEVAGFGVANVHDDDPLTGVAVVWEPGGATEPNRIRLALEEPTAVQEVGIAAGLGDEATDAPLVRRPSLIRLCADAGACQEVSLEDSDSLHLYDVELGDDVRSIDLTVLDVHDTGVTTYPLAVISEVRIVD